MDTATFISRETGSQFEKRSAVIMSFRVKQHRLKKKSDDYLADLKGHSLSLFLLLLLFIHLFIVAEDVIRNLLGRRLLIGRLL